MSIRFPIAIGGANLPSIIQFKNGNQIQNLYDASGKKLQANYYTRLSTLPVPLADGEVATDVSSTNLYLLNGNDYVGNFEYVFSNDLGDYQHDLDKIYNDEGYVQGLANPQYYYFRHDHLGDNREVWLANTNTVVQRTQYYPSGLPWVSLDGDNPSLQNKKYNGKEFVEMHGYDTYDIVWRQYNPATMRFQTQDPFAEKYYNLSPYTMCADNMVLHTDPDGRVFGVDNLVGAVVGAAVDYGEQVAANYASGSANPWSNNINLVSIGTAAVVGGLTSGASAVESVAAKTAIKVGASVINNTVKVSTGSNGLKVEVQKNLVNIAKNTAIDMTVDKVTGKISSKLVGNPIAKSATTNAGRLNHGAKAVVKATGNNVTRATTATVKKIVSKTAKVAEQTAQSAVKAKANERIEKIKNATNQ